MVIQSEFKKERATIEQFKSLSQILFWAVYLAGSFCLLIGNALRAK